MLNVENSCVTLDKVGECVINKSCTVVVVVVVVVVAVVARLYADIHHESFILMHRWGLMPWNVNHSNVEGFAPRFVEVGDIILKEFSAAGYEMLYCWN